MDIMVLIFLGILILGLRFAYVKERRRWETDDTIDFDDWRGGDPYQEVPEDAKRIDLETKL